ncbi:MAG: translocation/assembly module TamB domain-containing protein, partial [Thermodesulfovibrionales bacterium]
MYPLADAVTGRFSSEGKGFTIRDLILRRGDAVVTAKGQASQEGKLSLEAEGMRISLQEFLPSPPDTFARLVRGVTLRDLKLSAGGSFESPILELHGAISGEQIGNGRIRGTLNGKALELKASLFNDQCRITGKADLSGEIPWAASVEIGSARYNTLFEHLLKDVPEDLLVDLTGRISAHGNREHIEASASFDRANLHLYGIGFVNNSPLMLTLKDKDLSIGSFSMKSDTTEFKITGGVRIGEKYDLDLEGSSSLAPLMAVSKTLDLVKGNSNFVFSLSGDWNKPKINGGMDLTNGSLGVRGINYRLTAISAFLYVDEDRVIIERVTGKLSGGTVSLTGSAYLKGFSLDRFFLESRISGVTASVTKDLWANLDGELFLRGNQAAQTVTGDIRINKARYSERIEWKSWLLSARPREKPRVSAEILRNMTMNVRVRGDNLVVDNNMAQASLNVDFLLKGSPENPVILGKAETQKGLVYFRNNDFTIQKARADFSDPNFINPYFDIIAETRIVNYDIRLALYGSMEQFSLAVSSDPPLPESDIFSLLTAGRVEKDLKGMKGGIGASEATSFLTGKLQDVVEERMKTITGFDRVQVDSYVSRTTGTVTPRLTVSKRLMGDKLYATYSSAIGTGEEQVWKIEYILGKN